MITECPTALAVQRDEPGDLGDVRVIAAVIVSEPARERLAEFVTRGFDPATNLEDEATGAMLAAALDWDGLDADDRRALEYEPPGRHSWGSALAWAAECIVRPGRRTVQQAHAEAIQIVDRFIRRHAREFVASVVGHAAEALKAGAIDPERVIDDVETVVCLYRRYAGRAA